jgi:hypothetical protein
MFITRLKSPSSSFLIPKQEQHKLNFKKWSLLNVLCTKTRPGSSFQNVIDDTLVKLYYLPCARLPAAVRSKFTPKCIYRQSSFTFKRREEAGWEGEGRGGKKEQKRGEG